MKKILDFILDAKYWLLAILLLLVTFIFLAWIAYPDFFNNLVTLMLVLSIVIILIPMFLYYLKEQQVEDCMRNYLREPNQRHEDELCQLLTSTEAKRIRALGQIIRQAEDDNNQQLLLNQHYESYIEEWVHEIKKPTSLLSLVIANREEEMSELVQQRLIHVRNQIDSDVEKILYFARLNASHQDYIFQRLDLHQICREAVEEQASLLEEAKFSVVLPQQSASVLSDKKSLLFILGQIINNSVKYTQSEQPEIRFDVNEAQDIRLSISDNGPGVEAEDLPFIFDKSFSGESVKGTGIGLYLVKEMADKLAINIYAESRLDKGLTIILTFPKVEV